jgi:hypothetical protein
MLSFHLCLALESDLFLSDFSIAILGPFVIYHMWAIVDAK